MIYMYAYAGCVCVCVCVCFSSSLLLLRRRSFTVGLLYGTAEQGEDERFHNTKGSAAFEEFLDFLGDRIRLKGWTGMRGGLDVRSDSTGEHSIYVDYQRYNMMFHVSTLLPYYPQDIQQVERKRHIGNDVVVIVWNEGRGYFDPNMMHSQVPLSLVVRSRVRSVRVLL
jgi:RAP1 GTPase activating protein 1